MISSKCFLLSKYLKYVILFGFCLPFSHLVVLLMLSNYWMDLVVQLSISIACCRDVEASSHSQHAQK